MNTITYKEIYEEFCKWSPKHAEMIIECRPWGNNSIAIWLSNGMTYKVKYYGSNKFIMQSLSKDDINAKFNLK